jgi:threonine dehydratase
MAVSRVGLRRRDVPTHVALSSRLPSRNSYRRPRHDQKERRNGPLFSLAELDATAALVQHHVPPTPQYNWPLLSQRLGAELWVKHENHTPAGAFKVRGGVAYIDWLRRAHPEVTGVITATRGNHGQSIARAATAAGLRAMIYVPEGNSIEKNAAMAAFGAELVVHGRDFDEAKDAAAKAADREGLHYVASFHPALVKGVATYALEFFRNAPPLDTVYVPVGMGSGICGLITVRDLLGLGTEIVGVVSTHAPAIALSFEAKRRIATDTAVTFADGVACRDPQPQALDVILAGAARIVRVSDAEVANAMRAYFTDTHNVAEGAGAVPLAAALQEKARHTGRRVGVILCGGNIDTAMFRHVLDGGTPKVA